VHVKGEQLDNQSTNRKYAVSTVGQMNGKNGLWPLIVKTASNVSQGATASRLMCVAGSLMTFRVEFVMQSSGGDTKSGVRSSGEAQVGVWGTKWGGVFQVSHP